MEKQKRGIHIKRSYRSYFISYIVVLIVPLLITIYGYNYAYKSIEDMLTSSNESILTQSCEAYDQIFELTLKELDMLSSDSNIQSLMVKSGKRNAEDMFKVVDVKNSLANAVSTNSYCAQTLVYFYDAGDIITNLKRYDKAVDYLFSGSGDLGIDELLENTEDLYIEGYFVVNQGENASLVFYRHVYDKTTVFYDPSGIKATIFAIIPWNNIQYVADNISDTSDQRLMLFDSQNNIIGRELPEGINLEQYFPLKDADKAINAYEVRINGSSYIVSTESSKIIDAWFALGTAKAEAFRQLNYFRASIIIELVLCLISGIILAGFFAKKTFNPINNMIEILGRRRNEADSTDTIEDSGVYDNLEKALKDLVDDHARLEKNLSDSESFRRKSFVVGALKGWKGSMERLTDYFDKNAEEWRDVEYRLVLFAVEGVEQSVFFKDLNEEQYMGTWPLFVFSLQNVAGEIMLSDGTEGETVEIDNMIGCLLKKPAEGNADRLHEKVERVLTFYRDGMNLRAYAGISELHNSTDELSQCYNEACQAIARRDFGSDDKPEWIEKVKNYIADNYCDPEINITSMADRFNMSLSYMGRTFKKYEGEGMLDYIHKLRVEKCKQLLEEGVTVKDAAEQTGYIDSKAMIRAFKKFEGITPGQYKKQN